MSSKKIIHDSLYSVKVWRVWVFLGVQDIKARFRRSFLGPLWLMLHTVIFVSGAGLIYGTLFNLPLNEFLPLLTTGIVIWGFIVSSLTDAGSAFTSAEGYIKQFPYPKQIYLLRSLIGYVLVLLVGMIVILGMQLVLGEFSFFRWIWMIPGAVLLIFTALGHITIVAYLGARFRDLPHALTGFIQVMFFVTPVLFPAKLLEQRGMQYIYQVNPLFHLIEIVRHPILTGEPAAWASYSFVLVYGFVIWLLAFFVARRMDARLVFSL